MDAHALRRVMSCRYNGDAVYARTETLLRLYRIWEALGSLGADVCTAPARARPHIAIRVIAFPFSPGARYFLRYVE